MHWFVITGYLSYQITTDSNMVPFITSETMFCYSIEHLKNAAIGTDKRKLLDIPDVSTASGQSYSITCSYANTLGNMDFMILLLFFAQSDQFSNTLTDKWVECRNKAETCHFFPVILYFKQKIT